MEDSHGNIVCRVGLEYLGVSAVASVIEQPAFAPSPWAIVAILAIYLLPHVLTGLIAGFLVSFIPTRRRLGASSWVGFGCGVLGLLLNFGVMFALQKVWPEVAPSIGDLGVVHFATMAFGGVLALCLVRGLVRRHRRM